MHCGIRGSAGLSILFPSLDSFISKRRVNSPVTTIQTLTHYTRYIFLLEDTCYALGQLRAGLIIGEAENKLPPLREKEQPLQVPSSYLTLPAIHYTAALAKLQRSVL